MDYKEKQLKGLGLLWKYYDYNKTSIASGLGVSRETVQMWFKRGRVSATAALKIEDKTQGEITKEELRPDVTQWFGL